MRNANLDAIKAKRGQGINIKILLGEPEEDKMKPSDEMAPEAIQLDEHGAAPLGTKDHDMMAKEEMLESPEEKMMEMKHPEMEQSDQEMMKHMDMNEHMPSHKPRSIGERAKAALMMRMKK